jgi:V-type H+-transporting ATPase subunit D
MGEVMKEAAFSLAEAKFASGDFNQQILQNVNKAQIKVKIRRTSVLKWFKETELLRG